MSIYISNNNPNTIHISTQAIPDSIRDPRPLQEALQLYIVKDKNNLTTSEKNREQREYVSNFLLMYDRYCCLKCRKLLFSDNKRCQRCGEMYCSSCKKMVNNNSCPNCLI